MEHIKIIEKLINRCEECKQKECINCEISWTEVEAIKKLLDEYKKEGAKMRKIEVGEYVRTRGGHIHKINKIQNGFIYWENIKCGWNEEQLKDIVVKHRKQLIDLIEIGDIVEIIDVLNVDIHYIWNTEMLNAVKEDVENGLDLGRILTKEQFKANCYKVGGEDE